MRRILLISGIILTIIFLVFLSGCEDFHQANLVNENVELSETPFADMQTLSRLAEIDGNVDWRIARFFALKSLQDFRQANNWEDAVLSEYPLLIYNAVTGEPRYYEFRVILNGTEVGL